ncbi:MAG: hypothetical protein ACTSRG_03570 [Candidatus Helarchaeota archaeon]
MEFEYDRTRWAYYLKLGLLVGLLIEPTAAFLQLWVFNPWWFFIIWPIIWECFCFGTLGYVSRNLHSVIQYGLSAALGLSGEIFTIFIFPIWTFPNETVLFLQGLPVIVTCFTIIWGFLSPLMTLVTNKILGHD